MKKRILSILLTLVMVIGMLPMASLTAHAAENTGNIDDFNIKVGNQFILNPDYEMSGTGNLGGTWEYSNNYADNIPTVKLDNYKSDNGWIQLYDASPEGAVRFRIIVSGDCEITTNQYAIVLQANTNGYLDIWFDDNATLTINGGGGIYNYTNDPQTRIESHFGRDCNGTLTINATDKPAIWSMKLRESSHTSDGCLSVSDGVTLNTDGSINIGTNFVRRYDPDRWELVNIDLCVENNATVCLKNPELQGYNSLSQMYPFTKWSPAIQVVENEGSVVHIYTPRFVNQTPAGSYSETTGQNVMVGDPQTYTFNSNTAPTGYYVEKTATLKGLFAGLDFGDSVKTITPVTDGSAATLTHTFEKAGMYQLTETLKLYKIGKDTPAVTKTHVFLISVSEKPLVTPTITQQPESVTNATGNVTLTAKAENAERARWYVEKSDGTVAALGDALTDGTSTQTISKASNAVGNRYFCAFWSEDDKIAKTDSVTVCFVPTVTSNGNVTVAAGSTAFLKVTESGCGHYADDNGWYKDGEELTSGEKYYIMGTTLAVQNAAAEDEGTYTYKYVTDHGDVVTADVALTVNTGSSSATIDTFDIFGLDNPMIIGTYADTTVSVPENANYTAEVIDCTFDDASGVVDSGSGTVTIKLTPKTGFSFKPSGNINGTIDGITKAFSGYKDGGITVVVDYGTPTSSWKIAYPENDTVSITTDSLTFKAGTAANGQKVEGAFNCTHSGLADTDLHHTGMKYAVYSIADNAMPAGLTLNVDGTITGTPTTAGIYTVQVEARSVNASGTASNCSGLAVKAIEIVVESDAHIHDWDLENPVSDSATCTADGEKVISCKNGCSEKITVTFPATGHDWGEWPSYITPPCTAESDLVIERTCANENCPVGTERKTISRIHMAMDWTTDETHHWKVCGYCKTEILVEKDAHKDTNSDNKCDTCEYPMTPAGEDTPVDPEKTAAPAITYDEDTFTVEATGNGTVKVYVNGVEVTNPYTFEQGEEDVTYTVTATAQEEGKEISETATKSVTVPAKVVTPEPAQKYTITYTDGVDGKEIFADVVFTDVEEGSATPTISNPTRSGYTFTGWTPAVAATVTGNQTYTATWDKNSTGGGVVIPTVFPVTVKESDNGKVEASAKYAVPGSTVKLTVTPDEGYELDTLIVKSGSKFIDVTEKNGKYQFVMPFGSATVTATFKKIETPVVPVVPTFDDVAEDTYYFDAVEWAVKEGITSGTTTSTFSPDMTCTRAQAVTFLWRAAGSPEPKSNVMPFEDVAAEAYYYKAVLWAVENGITKGTSETTFSPDADCTRAQIVTFLWRAQKSPAADSVNPFTDVAADAYYVDAVLWAVEEKVTKGTSETTFSPDADCTRAQIVTFLYRALNEQ